MERVADMLPATQPENDEIDIRERPYGDDIGNKKRACCYAQR
jgi:hypothetical protein